jgi:hypothetical protein
MIGDILKILFTFRRGGIWMKQYAILLNPGHNRVYFKQSMNLAVSELAVSSQKMKVTPKNIE